MDRILPVLLFLIFIPFRFLRDRRKKWDQNVGPGSGSHFWSFFFVSLMIKYFPVALYFRNALMAKRTRYSPPEREEVGSIPAPSTLFFHISAPKGRNGDWIFLRRIGDYFTVSLQIQHSHFPLESSFQNWWDLHGEK